jgi:hypothetical protein
MDLIHQLFHYKHAESADKAFINAQIQARLGVLHERVKLGRIILKQEFQPFVRYTHFGHV